MPDIEGKKITYISEVLDKAQDRIKFASGAAGKALPGVRGKIIAPLREASTLLKSVEEVLNRSGMDKRLGFAESAQGIQPVTLGFDDEKDQQKRP